MISDGLFVTDVRRGSQKRRRHSERIFSDKKRETRGLALPRKWPVYRRGLRAR